MIVVSSANRVFLMNTFRVIVPFSLGHAHDNWTPSSGLFFDLHISTWWKILDNIGDEGQPSFKPLWGVHSDFIFFLPLTLQAVTSWRPPNPYPPSICHISVQFIRGYAFLKSSRQALSLLILGVSTIRLLSSCRRTTYDCSLLIVSDLLGSERALDTSPCVAVPSRSSLGWCGFCWSALHHWKVRHLGSHS